MASVTKGKLTLETRSNGLQRAVAGKEGERHDRTAEQIVSGFCFKCYKGVEVGQWVYLVNGRAVHETCAKAI